MSNKTRRYLTDEEAVKLNIELNEKQGKRDKARYWITEDQYNRILSERLDNRKSKLIEVEVKKDKKGNITSSVEKLRRETIQDVPDGFEVVQISTSKSTGQQWVRAKPIKEDLFNLDFNYLNELEKELESIKKVKTKTLKGNKVGVVTITDIHFGAYISDLNVTPEYNITILCEKLRKAALKTNRFNYDIVELHLLGDLIESFTGLNHKNSWKGLQKGMYGVKAIKLFVKLFKENFLDLLKNLNNIKIVAGNHDRTTSDNKEDTDGGAAELIAWGLENIGYNVEFNRSVITHKVNGVNHILMHGHLFMTMKKTTQELCWIYGEKGVFNYIKLGHLHSRIKKLSANKMNNFKMLMDDNIDCRAENIASIFTGNTHSEDGGWSTLSGFSICEKNEFSNGVDVFDLSL